MLRIPLLWFVIIFILSVPVQAETIPPITTLIGAGVWSRPAYKGADTNVFTPIPVVRYYGKPWFLRTTFGVLEGGVRAELLRDFFIGAQLAYEGGRDSKESDFLSSHNFPTLNPSLSWGAHLELERKIGKMPVIGLLRYRQDVESKRGSQADFRLTAGIFSGLGLNAGIFFQTTWANSDNANYYYGISNQQSGSSGLPAFNALSGEMFNSFGLLWSYDLTTRWMLLGSIETSRLKNSVLNSPLSQTSTNHFSNLGVAYQF